MVARELLRLNKPFAVLLPSDLVSFVCHGCPELDLAFSRVQKLAFLSESLVWLVSGLGARHDHVFTIDLDVAETQSQRVTKKDIIDSQGSNSFPSSVSSSLQPQLLKEDGLWKVQGDDSKLTLILIAYLLS